MIPDGCIDIRTSRSTSIDLLCGKGYGPKNDKKKSMCTLHQLEVKMSISCSYILHFTFILRLLFFCLSLLVILIEGLAFLLENYIRNCLRITWIVDITYNYFQLIQKNSPKMNFNSTIYWSAVYPTIFDNYLLQLI